MLTTCHIRINIRAKNGRFEASLSRERQPTSINVLLGVNAETLYDLSRNLTQNLVRAVRVGKKERLNIQDRELMDKEFHKIAEHGYDALTEIFGQKGLKLLKELQGEATRVILQVISSEFMFPWELLYEDYERDRLQYENFWGFKYIIYRTIIPHDGQDILNKSEIETTPLLVGLLADRSLPKVATVEIPFFRELERKEFIRLFSLSRSLDPSRRSELLDADLRQFLGQKLDIIHFACHARDSIPEQNEPNNEICLLLSKDFPLWAKDFHISKLIFGNRPLVILNACCTTHRDPRRTRSMVKIMFRYGARGVVTTECIIADTFAAAFSREFYPLLLEGQELGDALLNTRMKLRAPPHHNPLGLLYGLYASPYTRFIGLNGGGI